MQKKQFAGKLQEKMHREAVSVVDPSDENEDDVAGVEFFSPACIEDTDEENEQEVVFAGACDTVENCERNFQ